MREWCIHRSALLLSAALALFPAGAGAAGNEGVEFSGQEYSGSWEGVTELMYFDVEHQVAPAEQSLQCADCHSEEGRLDFVALGYDEDRATKLVSPAAAALPVQEEPEPVEPEAEGPSTEEAAAHESAGAREPALEGVADRACLACHGSPGMQTELPSGETLYLSIDEETYARSVHGSAGYACVQCHTDISGYPHDPITAATRREFVFQRYYASCAQCHVDMYRTTLDSVHQRALAAGNVEAAVCTDCHGSHDIGPPDEPLSRGSTICERCHSAIYSEYRDSVHGAALIDEGNPDVPSCIDCHGVHDIAGPAFSGTFHLFSPQICAECHNDPALADRYGLNADVYDTYVADFHGTTVLLFESITPDQDTNKPVCVDCHGAHDIRPSGDPTSSVMKENLLGTCQRCHPDATTNFPSAWLSHYRPDAETAPAVYFVDLFYRILIPAVIGGMLVFNATGVARSVGERLAGKLDFKVPKLVRSLFGRLKRSGDEEHE